MKESFLLLPLLFVGVIESGLYDRCTKNEDCGTLDAFCKNGTCLCIEGFKINVDTCVEGFQPRISCRKDVDCIPLAGNRTICVDVSCTCKPFHHLHKGKCIKNKGLEEICIEDYECYWGKREEERMGCIDGRCNCKSGSVPGNNRKCVLSIARKNTISILLFVVIASTCTYLNMR